MAGLEKITNYLKNLDTKELYRLLGIVFGVITLLIIALIYSYYRSIGQLQQQLATTNKNRDEVRTILEKYDTVLQQQKKVDEILSQDKTFKLKDYFNNVVEALGISRLISKEAELSSADLVPNYAEIKLDVSFSEMNMKQLSDLLYKIEQNERVYTKDLKITKNLKNPTIDVSLVIATFEATQTA